MCDLILSYERFLLILNYYLLYSFINTIFYLRQIKLFGLLDLLLINLLGFFLNYKINEYNLLL